MSSGLVLPAFVSSRVQALKFEGRVLVDAAHAGTPIHLSVRSDDGMNLFVGGQTLVNDLAREGDWYAPGNTRQAFFTPAHAGEYVIRIDYVNVHPSYNGGTEGIAFLAEFQDAQPAPVQDPKDPPPNNPTVGESEPVYLNTGDFYIVETDLVVAGRGLDFAFKRYYRSQLNYAGPLGYGWEFNYNRRLTRAPNGFDLILYHGYREQRPFRDVAYPFDDVYTFVAAGPDSWATPPGLFNRITLQPDGTFVLVESDGSENHFFALSGLNAGKLKVIRDRYGNEIAFAYDSAGGLATAVDTLGRTITFTRDQVGRITRVQDFTGRRVLYEYDNHGDLVSVRSPGSADFPSGRVTRYAYSHFFQDFNLNHNLLTITDPKGQTYLTNAYGTTPADGGSFDRVTSQVYGNGTLSYEYFTDQLFTRLLDRNGNLIDYGYTPEGTPTFVKQYTNRNIRAADPDFYLTTFAHNVNYDRTRTVAPGGNVVERVYDESNPNVLSQGNVLRVARRPFDGAPDTASLLTTMSYEPVFNLVQAFTAPRGYTYSLSYDPTGRLLQVDYPPITVPAAQTISDTFVHNAFGQIVEFTRPEGNKDCYEYYASGPERGYLRRRIADCGPGGLSLATEFGRDALGRLTSVRDPLGHLTQYEVDAENNVTRVVSPAPFNHVTAYEYDANGNLIRIDHDNRDAQGVPDPLNPIITTWLTYDVLDHLLTATSEIDATTQAQMTFTYDANENRTRVTFPLGNSEAFSYDERDFLFRRTRGDGSPEQSTVTLHYDANGNLVTLVDGRGHARTAQFDLFDRPIRFADPFGNRVEYTYDKSSSVTGMILRGTLTDAGPLVRLAESRLTYDEIDRPVTRSVDHFLPSTQAPILDGAATIRTFFDRNSRVVKTINDNNHESLFTYDGLDRVLTRTDHLGNVMRRFYDAASNISGLETLERSQVDGSVAIFTSTFTHDELDRLSSASNNLGQSFSFQYDSRHNVTLVVDPRGNATRRRYDARGGLLSAEYELRAGGGTPGTVTGTVTTSQSRDLNGRIRTRTDANGNSTSFDYDALNRITRIVHADGTTVQSVFDAEDNLTRFTDANGTVVDLTYDVANRAIQKSITRAAGVEGPALQTFRYDGFARPIEMTDEDATLTFAYDSLGLMTQETQNGLSVTSTYDGTGNLLGLAYPGGRSISFQYDELERTSAILSPAVVAAYQYIGPYRRLGRRTYANGLELRMEYDGAQRPTRFHHRSAAAQTLADILYGYDSSGNPMHERRMQAPSSGAGDCYGHDSLKRVVSARLGIPDPVACAGAPQRDLGYVYDGAQNRLQVTMDGVAEVYTRSPTTPEPADAQVNQYSSVGGENYGYDRTGNMTLDGKRDLVYAYDYMNRLVRVASAGTGATLAQYRHDPLGRRFEKSVGGTVTRYVFDRLREIEERNGSGTLTADYVHGDRIDEVLLMRRSGQDYYFHENRAGSISAVSTSAGALVEQYEYDPFGQPTIRNGSGAVLTASAIGNPFLFTGRRWDGETGLYDYRARMYDPLLGRFTTEDPMGRWSDGMNLGNAFAYVGNAAIRYTDPLGLGSKKEQDGPGEPSAAEKEAKDLLKKLGELAGKKTLAAGDLDTIAEIMKRLAELMKGERPMTELIKKFFEKTAETFGWEKIGGKKHYRFGGFEIMLETGIPGTRKFPDLVIINHHTKEILVVDWYDPRTGIKHSDHLKKTEEYIEVLSKKHPEFKVRGWDFNIKIQGLSDEIVAIAGKITSRVGKLAKIGKAALPSILGGGFLIYETTTAETDVEKLDAWLGNTPGLAIPIAGDAFEVGYAIGSVLRGAPVGEDMTLEDFIQGGVNWWFELFGCKMH